MRVVFSNHYNARYLSGCYGTIGLRHTSNLPSNPGPVRETKGRWVGLWRPLPLGVGLGLLAVLQWRHIRHRSEAGTWNKGVPAKDWQVACYRAVPLRTVSEAGTWNKGVPAKDWQVACYRAVPLRTVSRIWGWITNKEVPTSLRPFFFSSYATLFGCDLQEAVSEDLKSYKSLSEFFCRPLKEGARPIDQTDCVVSPADGRVLNFGQLRTCQVEQVKGVTYSLREFLGNPIWSNKCRQKQVPVPTNRARQVQEGLQGQDCHTLDEYCRNICEKEDTTLYQCVIYLAPGDYHRFHSPTEWTVDFRRHFRGELLSVNPKICRLVPNLFSLNERVVYTGRWKHGFFSMTAVGATNVGSIRVYFDPSLVTNRRKWSDCEKNHEDLFLKDVNNNKIKMKKGEPFGEFRLGSTVVMIFEAPKDFKFKVESGQRTYVGRALSISS
ncbi:unnamed protein product [Timema podura]|uniref:Phosphatidylserine decarboxylase proenzyme, mitochondrial n=1 Tax=Timema podura TaxID=61482 RepID=A0ABN7PFQ1_TIMPD|nr:unnamed protein product [Timema podura]